MIIFLTAFDEHIDRAAFSRLKEFNLNLKATKCEFMKSQVTYFDRIVSWYEIRTDPENSSAIENWPEPKTVKDSTLFLGLPDTIGALLGTLRG